MITVFANRKALLKFSMRMAASWPSFRKKTRRTPMVKNIGNELNWKCAISSNEGTTSTVNGA